MGEDKMMGIARAPKLEWNLNTIIQLVTLVGMIVGGVTIWVDKSRDIEDLQSWRTGHETLHKEAKADREAAIARFDERIKTLEETKIRRDSQIEALQGKTSALDQALSNTNNTLRDLSNKLNDVVADSRVSREILQRLEASQRRGVERQ